ncbi:MAG TPA: hypothetical protein VK997_12465, partial [Deferrisomatales bacterium]|nr:hypothetical protein [Deferrisomatales bacterium]
MTTNAPAAGGPCGGCGGDVGRERGRSGFEPVDERLLECRVAADLAGFAEQFLRVVGAHGPEAGESLLGGYVEWLGVDLVDAL